MFCARQRVSVTDIITAVLGLRREKEEEIVSLTERADTFCIVPLGISIAHS